MSKNQPFGTFEATKKLNLDRAMTIVAKQHQFKRDKIEPICSPKMYAERAPKFEESRFARDQHSSRKCMHVNYDFLDCFLGRRLPHMILPH